MKPMQIRIYRKKYVNGSVNSEGHLNKKTMVRRLLRPRSVHLCHQKPNPAGETVPFIINKNEAPEFGIIQKCMSSSPENFCHLIYHESAPKN